MSGRRDKLLVLTLGLVQCSPSVGALSSERASMRSLFSKITRAIRQALPRTRLIVTDIHMTLRALK